VVLAAQGPSPAADKALEKLCRTYWRPIYGFVRRQGVASEEAKDLTQGFFALLLERRDLETVRKEKGRLRSYLLTSLKHFLTNERNRAMAIKRGEGQRSIPLEDLHGREAVGFEAADTSTAEPIYERGRIVSISTSATTTTATATLMSPRRASAHNHRVPVKRDRPSPQSSPLEQGERRDKLDA